MTPGEDRPRRCIEITEAWARGEPGVTLDDVRKARRGAWAAAAAAAVRRYSTEWWQIRDRVFNEKKSEHLRRFADIVREKIPWAMVEQAALKMMSRGRP